MTYASLDQSATTRQYLSFSLTGEQFALPVAQVREIIEFTGLTEIPLLPEFLRGVLNLRGAVVPVVDLAVRFGRGRTGIARRTCVVIVELADSEDMPPLGVLVDAVNEVLTVEPSEIEPAPALVGGIRAEFVEGLIRAETRFVIALDLRQTLSLDDLAALAGLASAPRETQP
ncbi:chemotaxis protein CheW [Chitiniphilus eburneus]|uniref:Purine-binding chemotaxis protein CheW n=1 Tax=Chitiniphilus eburneus TaxID=2571148 RepID=A0A4U0QEC6_9NEIS|nr:chemotaxis protein CheW [Chitiniphilus eburneus]TJZ79002.1 purine-binding chemotaxis protein CheW [Chitiniphilus eburneus]